MRQKIRIFAADMKAKTISAAFAVVLCLAASALAPARAAAAREGGVSAIENLPDSILVDGQMFHVQGIALDRAASCMYMSFTNDLYKVDFQGNVVASVVNLHGHLGAMTFDPEERVLYASLEYKDDEIGAGINSKLNLGQADPAKTVFYVCKIYVDRITSLGMAQEGIIELIEMPEVASDYATHIYGCSGIDGVAIAPAIGTKPGRKGGRYLYVAYGIYEDAKRSDNDSQILLCYKLGDFSKPLHKYFVYTGNTRYGVQNLAYDEYTGKIFMAVYKGPKSWYPNYDLYALDVDQKPFKAVVHGVPGSKKVEQLRISPDGLLHEQSGITGWYFKHGSTGFCPIGDGYFYISEKLRNKAAKTNGCNARLYRWTGVPENPFEKVCR